MDNQLHMIELVRKLMNAEGTEAELAARPIILPPPL
jgi:hypothetical protein